VVLKVFHSAINRDKLNIGTVEIFHFEIDDKKFTVFFFFQRLPFTQKRDEIRYGHFNVFHSDVIKGKFPILTLLFHSIIFKQSMFLYILFKRK